MIKQSILFFGASGQLGSLSIPLLESAEIEVWRATRSAIWPSYLMKSNKTKKGFEIDLSKFRQFAQFLRENEITNVFHAASPSGNLTSLIDAEKEQMVRANLEISHFIANAILESGQNVSFTFFSSSAIFTPTEWTTVVDENTQPNPSSFYGEVKALVSERMVRRRSEDGLIFQSLVLFNQESIFRPKGFLIRDLIDQLVQIKDGESREIYVRDKMARADFSDATYFPGLLCKILQLGIYEDFVVSSGRLVSIEELIRRSANKLAIPLKPTSVISTQLPAVSAGAVVGNPSRAKNLLGWEQQSNIEDLIVRSVASLTSH